MKIVRAWLATCMLALFMLGLPHEGFADNSVRDALENNEGVNEGNEEEEGAGESGEQSLWGVLFQLGLALGAVILVMFLLLKLLANRTNRFQATSTMQNLGGIGLGQQKSVQLIRVGDRLLVVGVGQTIELLREIEDEAEAKALIALAEEQQTTDFTGKARALLKGDKMEANEERSIYSQMDVHMRDVKRQKESGLNRVEGRK
ncbi:flagellar biosynthetic protein FliO [Salicibibacter cibarius]|uniref:Flagellar biosynthetic protein FliO n=1 Tax=Salicibibacter cibarius TaxID=2743000 RepID=A0A7T7CBY3_9BACI|nr:flagellar biosynthetic protein FliO [Salicibibacter cibarius]QQK76368.1 flagellar biosynthetic protein FliO [Salicibibacter cibarius]